MWIALSVPVSWLRAHPWAWPWDTVSYIFATEASSTEYWMLVLAVLVWTVLGTQVLFFTAFYHGFRLHPSSSIRLAWFAASLTALIGAHLFLWCPFVLLAGNHWMQLTWLVLAVLFGAWFVSIPRRSLP